MLMDTSIEGRKYRCNQVVNLDSSLAKSQVEIGAADDDPAAVKYCLNELKIQTIEHE